MFLTTSLPSAGQTEVYKAVKRASESFLGVPSQCFNPQKGGICTPPRRGRDQYVANVVRFACFANWLSTFYVIILEREVLLCQWVRASQMHCC